MMCLSYKMWIEPFFTPGAANAGITIDNEDLRIRACLKICFGGYEPAPPCNNGTRSVRAWGSGFPWEVPTRTDDYHVVHCRPEEKRKAKDNLPRE
jgi:hypothetical protein